MIWYVPHIHFIILCYVLLSLTDYQIWSIIYLVSTNSKKRAHNDKSIHDEAVPRSALQLSADSDNRYSGWYGNRPDFTGCYKARCCCIRLENELFSDMNVQGVSCEDYIQLLFCFNAASSDAFRQGLRIENQHAYFKIQKTSMDCGHENMLY